MSFFNRMASIGSSFGKSLRSGVSGLRGGVSTIRRAIGSTVSFIDKLLDTAHSIPVLGPLADAVQNSSIYKDARGLAELVEGGLELGEELLGPVDEFLQKTQFGQIGMSPEEKERFHNAVARSGGTGGLLPNFSGLHLGHGFSDFPSGAGQFTSQGSSTSVFDPNLQSRLTVR